MIVVIDEAIDVGFEIARQVVVVEQDPVLERLVPTFDLAWVWGWLGAPRTCAMPAPSSHFAKSPET